MTNTECIHNLCDSCRYDVATCAPEAVEYAEDHNPDLRGAEGDAVVVCSLYDAREEKES